MRLSEPDGPLPGPMQRLAGGRTGLVPEMSVNRQSRGTSEAVLSQPRESGIDALVDADADVALQAAGKGRTRAESFASAVGEVVERYCLCWPGETTEATHRELRETGREVVALDALDLYEDRLVSAMGAEAITADLELPWCRGTNLLTGEPTFVPAQLVYLGLDDRTPALPATTNGAACGESLADALVRSVYEVVERDAFMRTWLRQETPDRVNLGEFPDIAAEKVESFDTDVATFELLALDGRVELPTVGCAVVDSRERNPKFAVCASADRDPAAALSDALVEGAQVRAYAKELTARYRGRDLDAARLDSFDDALYHYSRVEQFEDVSFLLDGEKRSLADKPNASDSAESDAFDAVLDALEAADVTPVAIDATTRDVAETGLRVTKVVVPELVPLTPPSLVPTEHPAFDGESVTRKPHPFP
ncbi:YcaO-like family protein [Halorussus pelagicus]|uniref:YcaO-like family protein n=1 Tax=Halorussus pelagicus TaxID=2505977 RepID=UPI000FFBF58C|nr:YcaO-like family protein [Halorussus pelagicus]